MPTLPGDKHIIETTDEGEVFLYEIGTEETIVHFNPESPVEATEAQLKIFESDLLTPEEKVYAYFWSGFFYRAATL